MTLLYTKPVTVTLKEDNLGNWVVSDNCEDMNFFDTTPYPNYLQARDVAAGRKNFYKDRRNGPVQLYIEV